MKRLDTSAPKQSLSSNEQLALYDRYGSLAYGIILQIIPQTHLAQEVLVELFASRYLQACSGQTTNLATCIVRLARARALEAKAQQLPLDAHSEEPTPLQPEDMPELVFDLAFRQGYAPDTIAEQLQIPKAEVMKGFHDYFKSLRQP
ncbi:DNA-directed RNA polymerase specialized sigma24 family protein [Rhabdobacter roseus]|uniref:DNA-directed RNA polymerase specialized sigma24 family protein n=1 Tax=Rhabdobacter roseus TaxID=1655419 RepID=A0A840U080_9BACT|nr:hypothetical protein [Rhabdobacter roseus]MBB5286953.1 DNA-directed RNA polymerase specialized sigma24 family protein [Rhabdobacter roseus]